MLLLRVIVTLVACWLVKCDLLDLYVQHMDETMRTMPYGSKRHPMDPVNRRIKRYLEEDEPFLKIGHFKKQRLDVDELWLKQWRAKKKIILYDDDALDSPNDQEENLKSDQYEIFSNTTQNSKDLEQPLTVLPTASENSNISLAAILKEYLGETSEDTEDLTDEDIDPEERVRKENQEYSEEMKGEDNSEYEIISENEQINPKLIMSPYIKRTPKGSRVPKKYFPEKPTKNARGAKDHVKDETATRSKRSASQGIDIKIAAMPSLNSLRFTRYEKLDEDGDVILEWDPSDEEEVIFKVTARTLGYIGIGFNEKNNMKGADILLAWVDDHTGIVNLLVSQSPARFFYLPDVPDSR